MSERVTSEEMELAHHPSPRQYVNVAIILAVITAIEVAIFYIEGLSNILVPTLLIFSLLKFALVVLWFMHLRFDNRLFRRLFVAGLILALAVFAIVLTIMFVSDPAIS